MHKEKAEAGFISLMIYLFYSFVMNGLQGIEPGIFSGIFLGILIAFVYNKWQDIKLPQPFQIYSGTRFVSIVLLPAVVLLVIGFSLISPFIQNGITSLVEGIDYSGNLGLFILLFR